MTISTLSTSNDLKYDDPFSAVELSAGQFFYLILNFHSYPQISNVAMRPRIYAQNLIGYLRDPAIVQQTSSWLVHYNM